MELGALVCTPRSPRCDACPVNRFCVAREQNVQEQLPNLGKCAKTIARRFIAFVIERAGKFLVRQRPHGVVNAHLWEFPNVEVGARLSEPQHVQTAARALKLQRTDPKPFCTIKHSITRYRITLKAYRARLATPRSAPSGHWFALRQLHKLAFTSAHKKILARIGAPSTASARSCNAP